MSNLTLEAKPFSLAAIASVLTGRLFCDHFREVQALMSFIEGLSEPLPQIGCEMSREHCARVLLSQHPRLRSIDSRTADTTNYQSRLADWIMRFGASLPIRSVGTVAATWRDYTDIALGPAQAVRV